MKTQSYIFASCAVVLVLVGLGFAFFAPTKQASAPTIEIASFEECVKAGNPVMESYPRQCRAGDKTFTEIIAVPTPIAVPPPAPEAPLGTSTESMITVSSPLPNTKVKSPLQVSGSARGTWYFEASFPVVLLDANGKTLAQAPAQATSDWMTTDFVPFLVTLTWNGATTSTGTLVLKKDNPSGLPEHEAEIRIPVSFQ